MLQPVTRDLHVSCFFFEIPELSAVSLVLWNCIRLILYEVQSFNQDQVKSEAADQGHVT